MANDIPAGDFAALFRNSAPYINAFRGRTFVIVFSGEALLAEDFDSLVHDFALLHTLGIRLVLVHGARPQIEKLLLERHIETPIHHNVRITGSDALQCAKEAVGGVRTDIEALLSMGLANSPMAGVRLRVTSPTVFAAVSITCTPGRSAASTPRPSTGNLMTALLCCCRPWVIRPPVKFST
jgi:amino-acid N-acetyltransferase